jgi:hypothetical protein
MSRSSSTWTTKKLEKSINSWTPRHGFTAALLIEIESSGDSCRLSIALLKRPADESQRVRGHLPEIRCRDLSSGVTALLDRVAYNPSGSLRLAPWRSSSRSSSVWLQVSTKPEPFPLQSQVTETITITQECDGSWYSVLVDVPRTMTLQDGSYLFEASIGGLS